MSRAEGSGRRRAREAALQMLYQSEIGREDAETTIGTFWAAREPGSDLPEPLRAFGNGLVRGTMARLPEIDGILGAHAQNWRVERMAVIDRLVLRLAVYELLVEAETPSGVVINEALELARTYSGDESVAFVNGVLDSVRKELRRG